MGKQAHDIGNRKRKQAIRQAEQKALHKALEADRRHSAVHAYTPRGPKH